MVKKILVVGGDLGYTNWFPFEIEFVRDLNEAELIVFTGGSDVDPRIYNESEHPTTYSNYDRDLVEQEIFNEAKELGILCVGVCRGSQFLCCMAGGKLVQHQQNPMYIHDINTYDDKAIKVTSTHHQAAYPFDLSEDDYKVLGWTENISEYHEDGDEFEMNPPLECEIVYYPKINALGIQSHPEHYFKKDGYEEDIKWFQDLLIKFLNKEL